MCFCIPDFWISIKTGIKKRSYLDMKAVFLAIFLIYCLRHVSTAYICRGCFWTEKSALYTIHVGNFTFHFFSILHLTFQKNTQEFLQSFEYSNIDVKKK